VTAGPEAVAAADRQGLREMPCLFCGEHDERVRFAGEPFRVVECARCGLVYVNPRLPEARLHEMYQDEYWSSDRAKDFGYTAYLADAALYLRTYAMRSRVIDKYKPRPGAVLDVGCAAGFFLKVMADKGWDTTGLEISASMVAYAREQLRLGDVRRGHLESIEFADDARFDVVALWDVIEHLERPDLALARAAALLKDDGILVLETQNIDSRWARFTGPRWQHFKHEEHLYHFSPATLERLLNEAGLELLENTPRRSGKYVSFDFIVERVGKLHPFLSVLASPLRLMGGASLYVNLRDEMVVVARKARSS